MVAPGAPIGSIDPKPQKRIRLRLLIGCLTPLLVAVACQAAYTIAAQHRAMVGGLEEKARSTAALLADVVGPSLMLDDPKGVRDGLGYMHDDPDLLFAAAIDESGAVTARGRVAERLRPLQVEYEPRLVSTDDEVVAVYPLMSGDGVVGSVAVGFTTANVRAHADAITLRVILIASGGMICAVVIVLLLARAIVRRNRDLKLILDSADQGFLNVSRAGALLPEHSAVVESWFGPWPKQGTLWSYVGSRAPDAGSWIELLWENVTADVLPLEMALDQMPSRIAVGERSYELDLKPILVDGRLLQILVIVSDITARLEQERARTDQRELVSIFQWLLKDRSGIVGFFAEADAIVARLCGGELRADSAARDLHTLKGNCSVFGLETAAALCQEIETRVAEGGGGLSEAERRELAAAWRRVGAWRSQLLPERDPARIEIDAADHRALAAAIARGWSHEILGELVADLVREPVKQRLVRFGEQARALARRLGRGEIEVGVEGTLRVAEGSLAPFWNCFAHLVRNAIDHGLESPEERIAAGKPPSGRIDLRAALRGNRFIVEIEDDGRGIDWERVAERARAAGLPAATPDELEAAIFAEGLSTKDAASETSGRGVGMSAVRAACDETGGSIEIFSEDGQGTRLRFTWPATVVRPAGRPFVTFARSECA